MTLALTLTGCAAGTRVASVGRLPDNLSLVTLVVSEDLRVVRTECRDAVAHGTIYGCQMSWPVRLATGGTIRSMKIVRYTDALPSPIAFEIDAHELCHAVAALQSIADPCHAQNGGVLTALPRPPIDALHR